MENLKGISVRVDPRNLEEIDRMAKEHFYHKRSDYINAGIRLMIAAEKAGLMEKFLRFDPRWGDVIDEFKFEYHRGYR